MSTPGAADLGMDSIDLISLLVGSESTAQLPDRAPLELANPHAAARAISVAKGEFWPHELFLGEPGCLGTLIVSGLILRGVAVTDRPTVEVLGPGDLIRSWERELDPYAEVSAQVRWWALRPTRLAVLDASFIHAMAEHPEVVSDLLGRLWRRSEASSLRLAIVQQPCLSTRLHLLLCQLAARFGRPEGGGMLLPVPLCHALLSWLAGARRPAVSRSVSELERAAVVVHRDDGTWWLAREARQWFVEPSLHGERVAA